MTVDRSAPDPKWIKHYLKEAADTLRRLPRTYARPRLTQWPEVVRNTVGHETSGAHPRLAAPSPAAIDRLDESLGWMFACTHEQRRVVWARACGVPWRKLEDIDGRSHVTLRRVEDRGIAAIGQRLREAPPTRRFDSPL